MNKIVGELTLMVMGLIYYSILLLGLVAPFVGAYVIITWIF